MHPSGMKFDHPLGLAAGFDKRGEVIAPLLNMGFSFIEIGGSTPKSQPGNPKPRMFRLSEDKGIINRMGLNSVEHEKIVGNLCKRSKGIVGVNLAKNTDTITPIYDYVQGIRAMEAHSNFFVLNVSCPNVPETDDIRELVRTVKGETLVPILIKISPDWTHAQKRDIADIAITYDVDGLVVGNTTLYRPDTLKSLYKNERGGLSGEPIKQMMLECVREMYQLTNGNIPIIGVGGISSGKDAYDQICAGESLIQIWTSLIYEGPGVILKIRRELAELIELDGFDSVEDCVGINSR